MFHGMVRNNRTDNRSNWRREPSDFAITKSSPNYETPDSSQGFYHQNRRNGRHGHGQGYFPRNTSPSPLKFIKNQRSKTPMPESLISSNAMYGELKTRSPVFARNMGHRHLRPTNLKVLTSPYNNHTIKTEGYREQNSKKHVESRETNFERERTAQSEESDDDDRIRGNTFINIPKVKTNYNKFNTKSPSKFKRSPKRKHFNFQQNWNEDPSELRARKSPIINSRRIEQGNSHSIMSNLDSNVSRFSLTQGLSTTQTPISKRSRNLRSFNNFSHLDDTMKLDFDVFNKDKKFFRTQPSKSVNKAKRTSKLMSQLQFQKEIQGNLKKEPGQGKVYFQSMFNIKDQMISKLDEVPVSKENKMSSIHGSNRHAQNNSRHFFEDNKFKSKSEEIIYGQMKQIRMADLEREMKIHTNGSRQNYKDSILVLNGKLETLKKEYMKKNKHELAIMVLKKKKQRKRDELIRMAQAEKSLMEKHGLSGQRHEEISHFERNLNPTDKRRRLKKIKYLKGLEQKDRKYREKLDTLENEMESKIVNVLNNKTNFVEEEMKELKNMLEDDFDNKFLIGQMKKMVSALNVNN